MKLFFAAKAVIEKDGKVLLLREGGAYQDGTNIGKWDIPGGRLNPAESVRDGLLREVREETGLDVEPDMKPISLGEWWPKPRGEEWHVIANVFKCRYVGGEVKLGEDHDEFCWVGNGEWQPLPLASNVDTILQNYWN